MKDIEIKIKKETRMVEINKYILGNDGENLQGNIVFTFEDEFVDGQGRLEYLVDDEKKYIFLDKKDNAYSTPIKSFLTKKGSIDMQLVIIEGTGEENIPIFKSNMFYLYCNSSINAEIEEPEGMDSWVDMVNSKLNKVDIIENNGDGTKFLSDDGTYKFVKNTNDEGTITDVLVDGVSVVTDGVANIDFSNVTELDKVLRNILEAIQTGTSASMIIEEIEQLIVSYFENKIVEEVEA
jgi:hypothetical protein